MEALIEEAVEPSNSNFEIDLDQTMNEKIMDEKLRSGKYLFVFCPEKLEIILKTFFLKQIDSKCVVISGSEKGKPCVFKGFKFRGKSQNMCLPYYGKYWCATELRKNGQYKKWGWCSEACPYPDKGFKFLQILWKSRSHFLVSIFSLRKKHHKATIFLSKFLD